METCFVVMGFGVKTDYQSGRKLDLDKSYQNLIKPAVEAAGLSCIRADEIQHSGTIDVPMYEQLLTADVVIADVSTMNPNAFYELGVRHALRPFTTIIVSESELKFPFDLSHLVIRTYRHLGEDIGFSEAQRFQKALSTAIREIRAQPKDDSPVYTFLQLVPPSLRQVQQSAQAVASSAGDSPKNETLRALLDEAESARKDGNWADAKFLFQRVRTNMQKKLGSNAVVDPYILQQLALATYKADGSETGLRQACAVMWELQPETSNDPETLGLWGAIHKRLWEVVGDRGALDESITAYERGFYLRNDYYNGINFAFLLNVRANISAGDEAIADRVMANRIRKQVIRVCEKLLKEPEMKPADRYWAKATIAEAYFGLADQDNFVPTMAEAATMAPEGWMVDTTKAQIKKLGEILAKGAGA